MTTRPIIRYPDPRLALPAQPVAAFDGALRELVGDLLETMHREGAEDLVGKPATARNAGGILPSLARHRGAERGT